MKLFNQLTKVLAISLLCIAITGCHQDPIAEPIERSENVNAFQLDQVRVQELAKQYLSENPVLKNSARSAYGTYLFFVGFPGFPDEPTFAMASQNGHTIEMLGGGAFNAHPKEILFGDGTFVHRDENDVEVFAGTWTAEDLLSFQDYGPSPIGATPPDWRAGYANIRVNLVEPGLDAILRVYCLLPGVQAAHNAPASTPEGSVINVQGGLNFNKIVELFPGIPFGGPTLFVSLD